MLRPFFVTRLLVLLVSVGIFLPSHADAWVTVVPGATKTTQRNEAPTNTSKPLLPKIFSGWQLTGTPVQTTSPQVADDKEASALKEYGFVRYEAADYVRDQDTLTIKAMEFGDATGAYGTFTFYRGPDMQSEQIGQGAAFDGVRILFWSGAVLIDAKFSRITPMSAAELRDLATLLPKPVGNLAKSPTLPGYLPQEHLDPRTIRYAIGPEGYQRGGGVLPPGLVRFDLSAEAVTAQYNALNGTGTLTIIDYPTSEIATDREHAIHDFFTSHGTTQKTVQGNAQNLWTPALAGSNPAAIRVRRSGPLVIVTSGSFSPGAAQQISQRVHYEVNLTMSNSAQTLPDTAKVAQIILNVAFLVGIFALIAIVAAISLGGGRVLWRRMRNKSGVASDESSEFIRLNLKD